MKRQNRKSRTHRHDVNNSKFENDYPAVLTPAETKQIPLPLRNN